MKGLFETSPDDNEPLIFTRVGFELTVPQGLFKGDRPRGSYAKVHRQFVARLDELQCTLQGLSPSSGSRASVMRNRCTCHLCGIHMTPGYEWEFQHGTFIWPESYLHLVDQHGLRPPMPFYREVVRATVEALPATRLEAAIARLT